MNPPINLPNSIHSGSNAQQTSEDEVSLIEVLGVLVRQKNLILASTAILTLLSVGYILVGIPAPVYQTTTGFSLSQEALSPKPTPNKNLVALAKLKKSLYQKFLAQIQSYNFQKDIFDSGGFLTRFVGGVSDSTKPERVLLGIHNSITLKDGSPNKKITPGKQVFLEMAGSKPEVMEDFLNILVKTAAINIQEEASNTLKSSVDQRLKTVFSEKELLRESIDIREKKKLADARINAKKKLVDARMNAKKTLEDAREKAKKKRAGTKKKLTNEIKLLAEQLNMARSLNINENNFKIQHNAPKWFLYGANILETELKALKSKATSLNNAAELEKVTQLKKLTELEKVTDIDDLAKLAKLAESVKLAGFANLAKFANLARLANLAEFENIESLDNAVPLNNKKLLAMETELEKWNATKASLKTANIVVISQPGISLIQPPKSKGTVIIAAMVLGLILGVLLAFIKTGIEILRKNEELPVKSESADKRFELENDRKRFEFKSSPQTFHVHS